MRLPASIKSTPSPHPFHEDLRNHDREDSETVVLKSDDSRAGPASLPRDTVLRPVATDRRAAAQGPRGLSALGRSATPTSSARLATSPLDVLQQGGRLRATKGESGLATMLKSLPSGMTSSLSNCLLQSTERRPLPARWGLGRGLSAGKLARQVKSGKMADGFRAVTDDFHAVIHEAQHLCDAPKEAGTWWSRSTGGLA